MNTDRRFALVAALFVFLTMPAYAGSPGGQEHHGQGYVFFGPGAWSLEGNRIGLAHFGGGGEALPYKGIGIGGEVGYFALWEDFSNGFGMVSLDGSYHFNRARKISPFVTAGYSAYIRNGHANFFNIGGGMNYWFHDRMGLRLEFRDHMREGAGHIFSGRIGLSFR